MLFNFQIFGEIFSRTFLWPIPHLTSFGSETLNLDGLIFLNLPGFVLWPTSGGMIKEHSVSWYWSMLTWKGCALYRCGAESSRNVIPSGSTVPFRPIPCLLLSIFPVRHWENRVRVSRWNCRVASSSFYPSQGWLCVFWFRLFRALFFLPGEDGLVKVPVGWSFLRDLFARLG